MVFAIADISVSLNNYYVQLVPCRSANILLFILIERVEIRSIIGSDQWAAYINISESDFEHFIVNHNFNLVNSETRTHTQNIESLWNKLKKK